MSETLRDRIATAILNAVYDPLCNSAARSAADAVVTELADQFVNFGAWLAEEITGRTMTRIDLESRLQEWLNEKGGADAH